jgi:hypothetical protein
MRRPKRRRPQEIRRSDHFSYLWAGLRKALELFAREGRIPDLTSRQAEVEAILGLRRELGCPKRKQAIKSFAAGWECDGGYDQRAEEVYQELLERYPPAVVEAAACGWQLERQATNSKDYIVSGSA